MFCIWSYALLYSAVVIPLSTSTVDLPTSNEANCNYAISILVAQDVSQSYVDDLPVIKKLYQQLMVNILKNYPESQFKFSTFTDVPVVSSGCAGWRDHCYNEVTTWTNSTRVVDNALSGLKVAWGLDYPEASLMVMRHIAAAKKFPHEEFTLEGRPIARILLLSTDDTYHTAKFTKPEFTKQLYDDECARTDSEMRRAGLDLAKYTCCPLPFEKIKVVPFRAAPDLLCGYDSKGMFNGVIEDYPEDDDLTELVKQQIHLIILSETAALDNWQKLAEKYRAIGGVAFVSLLRPDSSNLIENVQKAMTFFQPALCKFAEQKNDQKKIPKASENKVSGGVIAGASAGAIAVVGAAAAVAYAKWPTPKLNDPEEFMEMAEGHEHLDRETEQLMANDNTFP